MSREAMEIFDRAHHAGLRAASESSPTPMIVGSPSTPFGSDIDFSNRTYFVEGGVCGFASVIIKPARGKLVSYLKSKGLGWKHYYGGWNYPVRDFGQSLARKEAYAEAFSKTLGEVGIRSYVDSRMD